MWGCDTYKVWRATDREVEIQYLAGGFVKYFWTILNLTKYCNENWRMKSSRCLCDSLSSVLNMICVGRILQRIQSVYWESAVCLSLKKVNVLNSLVITFFFINYRVKSNFYMSLTFYFSFTSLEEQISKEWVRKKLNYFSPQISFLELCLFLIL